MVIDNSGSMGRRWAETITGALTFIRDSQPEDEIFVVHFSDDRQTRTASRPPFLAEHHELRTALVKGIVGGHTALYDGIAMALDQFEKASKMKKVLLIVSDGGDNRSHNRLNDIVKRADRAGVLMYTIGLFDEHSEDKNPGVLKQLASQTGGLPYLPKDLTARDRRSAHRLLATFEISTRSRTTLQSFRRRGYHQIKVTALDADNSQLRVRARTGFFGVKSPTTKETVPQPRPSPQ